MLSHFNFSLPLQNRSLFFQIEMASNLLNRVYISLTEFPNPEKSFKDQLSAFSEQNRIASDITQLIYDCYLQSPHPLKGQTLPNATPYLNPVACTPFQWKVYQSLTEIPRGEVRSYSDLAKKVLGSQKAARAIGTALAKNPFLIIFPCHRIIQKTGSLGNFSAGKETKELILLAEASHNGLRMTNRTG